jgi:competence protein ComGC
LTKFANSQQFQHVYFTKRQSDKATKRQSDKATKRQSVKSKNKSFTLLEIVFTIVIIGILLAIFLPVMSSIKLAAQKVKDQSNLKIIASAWKECAIERGGIDQNLVNATGFVQRLAGFGKTSVSNMVFNDPNVCISPSDKYASKVQWPAICKFVDGKLFYIADAWSKTLNLARGSDTRLFSYCFIANLPGNVPLGTTPLGFTRGLKINGKWHSQYGLYGDKGGYVVFCDGHTTWFDGSKPAKFLKWDQSGYTSDIREAVPVSAFISGGITLNPNVTDTDDSIMLLEHKGTGMD